MAAFTMIESVIVIRISRQRRAMPLPWFVKQTLAGWLGKLLVLGPLPSVRSRLIKMWTNLSILLCLTLLRCSGPFSTQLERKWRTTSTTNATSNPLSAAKTLAQIACPTESGWCSPRPWTEFSSVSIFWFSFSWQFSATCKSQPMKLFRGINFLATCLNFFIKFVLILISEKNQAFLCQS
jgi:hypothetical protein